MRSQSLHRMRSIAIELKANYKAMKVLATSIPYQRLSELLQDRDELAHFVQLYWDVMENTHRVLHGPTFWQKYQVFCEQPSNTDEAFVAILLLMVASVRCMYSKRPTSYRGLSSVEREMSVTSITACELWLFRQSRKHSSIELVQIRILLYIAKRANSFHKKRSWEEAVSLKSFGLRIGLHRDPKLLEKALGGCHVVQNPLTSELEKEMRRRLWATITEIELQAAFDAGFPSALSSLRTDCGVTSNINDEDIQETSTPLPSVESLDFYTSSSFLCISSHSFMLRSVMNQLINDTRSKMSYKSTQHYHARVMTELENMPLWIDAHRRSDNASSPAALPALLLDIQLRQFLLLLHLPFAQQADHISRYGYSRMVCLNTANTILGYHSKLAASGNCNLLFLREDVFRSAMAMCHSIIAWRSIQSKYPSSRVPMHVFLTRN